MSKGNKLERDILLCAYGFPPGGGPTERRWAEFVRYLASRGWRIDVLTIDPLPKHPHYDAASLALVPEEVRVFRTPPTLSHWYQALRYRKPTATNNGRQKKPKWWVEIPYLLYSRLLWQMIVPDQVVDWVPAALICGWRLLRQNNYKLIVSSSSPPTSHLVGYMLHKWSKRPWCGDWSDPLAFSPGIRLSRFQKWADSWLERKMAASMDVMVLSTESTKAAYLAQYPSLAAENLKIVRYGYTQDILAIQTETAPRFRLVYAGVFLKSIRPPYPLFDAMRLVRDLPVELVVAGVMQPEFICYAEKQQMENIIKFIGPVPHEKAIALAKGATMAVLVGNKGGLQIPGKVFDLIAIQRPILSVRFEANDLAAELVIKHNRGPVVSADAHAIANTIRQCYDWYCQGILDRQFDLEPLDEYSWLHSGMLMERILVGISGQA
jgi:glycosyltransferase involved in cell wall biosynthesis